MTAVETRGPARQAPPAASIPPSCLHAAFRATEQRERVTGRPVNRLHVGEPDFGPPAEALDALLRAVRDGRTAYTCAEGLPELREALAAKLIAENGHDTTPEHVLVTPGSCQGLAAVFQSLATHGDRILLPELHWPIHLQQVLLAGLQPILYPLRADHTPDVEAIAALAEPGTTAVLVNSPSNPTGAIADLDTMRAILDLADRHHWAVVSDEAYEHFAFDGVHTSFASLERDLPRERRRVFSTFSFSKSFAMTGLRLGYVVAPTDTTARTLRTVQEATIIAPATPVQHAGLAALTVRGAARRNRESVLRTRDTALGALLGAGLLPRLPAGGWYAVLDVSSSGLGAEAFAAGLIETEHVAVAPASGFALRPVLDPQGRVVTAEPAPSSANLIRIAICGARDDVAEGAQRIARFAARHRR